ncbi:uncharacterized protein LOC111716726 [Eurytemora carolleeae]|uniref:uncharacterized protein LOC111716726 n=1 Tax=Eurytemora carolleeae TaxID=1294199 RepID=UPI000C78AE90|nr:uncharacterized protein LOC111716726 [Eurytemora carolleeae]|eukprot:XP_023347969.1 uncharacterized protein LOC111716726 [Eurytemora affinis]
MSLNFSNFRRSIVPLRKYIGEVSSSGSWDGSEINHLSLKVQRFCQDALISFPKSLAVSGRSPRFHETLKISVENIVLIFLHDLLWALVCSIHRDQDTRIHSLLTSLYRQGLGGRGRAGRGLELREELCVPLPAALVELSALDQANTPLDRLTVIHDTVNQLHAHVREYLEKTNPKQGYSSYPSQQEETVLLSTLIIQSRLRHICSTIFYIKHFGFSSPSTLVYSFQTFQCSIEYLEKLDNRTKPTQPPGLKLEDLIRIADRLERRKSEELEILTNPVQELYFRDLIQRLELCSMELTKTQEEHWTRLGREVSETDEEGRKEDRSLLSLLHQKLLCNKTILENG